MNLGPSSSGRYTSRWRASRGFSSAAARRSVPATARDYFSLGPAAAAGLGHDRGVARHRGAALLEGALPRHALLREHARQRRTRAPGVEVRLIDVPDKDFTSSVAAKARSSSAGPTSFRATGRRRSRRARPLRDGWLRTGDWPHRHGGNIYLTGRSKFMHRARVGREGAPGRARGPGREERADRGRVVTGRACAGKAALRRSSTRASRPSRARRRRRATARDERALAGIVRRRAPRPRSSAVQARTAGRAHGRAAAKDTAAQGRARPLRDGLRLRRYAMGRIVQGEPPLHPPTSCVSPPPKFSISPPRKLFAPPLRAVLRARARDVLKAGGKGVPRST